MERIKQFSVHPCSMYSFKIEKEAMEAYAYDPTKCPVLIWQTEANEAFVFFPDVNRSGIVQFAIFPISDMHPSKLTPEAISNQQPILSAADVYKKYIEPHFGGISSECQSIVNYPFTMLPGENFAYDSFPDNPNVSAIDAGSAHGYKHAFAVGQQVAQHILTGKSEFDVEKTFGSFFENMEKLVEENNTSVTNNNNCN